MRRSLLNLREGQNCGVQEEFKCPMLRLPSWDQPALINWEPLEPPSPYLPVVQKRMYPSVVSGLFGTVSMSRSMEKSELMNQPEAAVAEPSHEMRFVEERAAQLRLFKEETEERETIIFSEQLESTRLWVGFLRGVSILLQVDIQSAEEEVRGIYEREEGRQRMCYMIEKDTVARLIRQRMEDDMRKRLSNLMPSYEEVRKSIVGEEAKELEEILDWFKKKRPFGMRLPMFLGGERGRINPKKPAGRNTKARGGRRQANSFSKHQPNVHSEMDSWPDAFPEVSYLEEGRRAWSYIKMIKYTQEKGISSTEEIEEPETAARVEIFAQEAGEWLSIMARFVNEYYKAKKLAQERDMEELIMMEEQLKEMQRREAILARLENEASIDCEQIMLEELKDLESQWMEQGNEEDNNFAENKTEVRQRHDPASSAGICQPQDVGPCTDAVARDEENGLWDIDSEGPPLYPMLGVVFLSALERDSYAGLRTPFLSALAEAQCMLAACEGRSAGIAAEIFASASCVPFCPVYLVQGLWWSYTSGHKAKCPGVANDAEENVAQLHGLVSLETEARLELLMDQMAEAWKLYQKAAEEASIISNTSRGEVYYVGVRMPINF
ncbi:hypothetical protein BCY84_18316 [Trypanosoma cruzi cruzi]|uniref:Uncharacterized protein n=1 Tax=Trypanosoma cruzi TaxID=5693 RepID=A0A2V2UR64_TRYCR|nr:hypothetical protein BCY84_18316 [Trypanosoma cruzi cruzi]PWU85696.1 hypothetical protein C4B63_148g33 [Trypanosoma cruzi]